jgi:hypothetical protein
VTSSRPAVSQRSVRFCSGRDGTARHGTEQTPLPPPPRSAYSVASCLAVGYLATLCCVIQRWDDMSQYYIILIVINTCVMCLEMYATYSTQEGSQDSSCCPSDVAIGFFLKKFSFETMGKKTPGNSSFDNLYCTSSSSKRAANPSFGHYQSQACPGCRLRLKAQSH